MQCWARPLVLLSFGRALVLARGQRPEAHAVLRSIESISPFPIKQPFAKIFGRGWVSAVLMKDKTVRHENAVVSQ